MAWWKEKNTWRLLLLITLAVAAACLLYLVRGLFFSFALAALLSYLINPLVVAITRKGTPRVWAILLVYLALFFIVAGILMYGTPRFVDQLNRLSATVPLYTEQTREIVQSIQQRYTGMGLPDGMRQVIDERIHWVEEMILTWVSNTLAAIVGSASYFFKILLAPVLSFYILKDLELIKDKAYAAAPPAWRDDIKGLLKEIDQVLGSFVKGYFLVAAVVGGLTVVAMVLLGVDFPLMLGLFSGLTELIPYFGPVIGAVPAVGLAVLESKWLALKVAAVFFVIHQLEGNFISPKIMGDKVGLHPLVVILSLLAGGELYGLAGMLLAVPVAAVLRVIMKFVFIKIVAWR
ncbi:MAG: AI-2E family transporter [Desulfotomaculaceae bacterium]